MSIPELTKRGYPESLILGTLAGSATLGLLIPPSIILIVYGVATEQSIAGVASARQDRHVPYPAHAHVPEDETWTSSCPFASAVVVVAVSLTVIVA